MILYVPDGGSEEIDRIGKKNMKYFAVFCAHLIKFVSCPVENSR